MSIKKLVLHNLKEKYLKGKKGTCLLIATAYFFYTCPTRTTHFNGTHIKAAMIFKTDHGNGHYGLNYLFNIWYLSCRITKTTILALAKLESAKGFFRGIISGDR